MSDDKPIVLGELIKWLQEFPPDMEIWRWQVVNDLPVEEPFDVPFVVSADGKRLYIQVYDGIVEGSKDFDKALGERKA